MSELNNSGFFEHVDKNTLWEWVLYLEGEGEEPDSYLSLAGGTMSGSCEI